MLKLRILPLVLVSAFIAVTIKASDLLLDATKPTHYPSSATAFAQVNEAQIEDEQGVSPEAPILSPNAPKGPEAFNPNNPSKVERELLESLSKRREELEKWSNSISIRENILHATELKINNKMDELKELEATVSDLLSTYHNKEDEKIRSLVKIYENMKPKDAAKIFNELDMDILLPVVNAMSERRVAPILASLDPDKARSVTRALSEERKLEKNTLQ